MSDPPHTNPTGELSDAEYWILLSLDADELLAGLLMPIVVHVDGQKREVRPPLGVEEASEALTSLVHRGLVEIRGLPIGVSDPDEGRALTQDEAQQVLSDPGSWRFPSGEPQLEASCWAAITPVGEEAYVRAERMRR